MSKSATASISAIKLELASLPDSPSETLSELARDACPQIRQRVGANPNTPVSSLCKLAVDPTYEVREAVAANPSCPEALRRVLLDNLHLLPVSR